MKSRDLSDLNKVWEIKTLKLSRQDECHAILERIAKQVGSFITPKIIFE